LESRFQVVALKIRHLLEYLFRAQSRSKQIKYIRNPDAHAAYAWTASTLFRVYGYAFS
jgi:hypothetical protein